MVVAPVTRAMSSNSRRVGGASSPPRPAWLHALVLSAALGGGLQAPPLAAQATCSASDAAVTEVITDATDTAGRMALAGDCATLLGIKATLEGTASLNWATTLSMARWRGVNVSGGRVIHLFPKNSQLTGTIPDLSALTALTHIQIENNELSGTLTASHFPTSLIDLTLSNNQLTGTVPDLSALTALQYLWLHENELSGTIPDLSALTALRDIWLDQNELSGTLTASHFPTSLIRLRLNNNQLTGTIPDLSALTALEYLWLHQNELSGTLTASHFPTSLIGLRLYNNKLTGTVPDLSAATALQTLWLSNNQLTGTVPDLSALTALRTLSIGQNRLNGSLAASHFPASLVNLVLNDNRLTGTIPDLSALTALRNLWLHENQLFGTLTLAASRFPAGLFSLLLGNNGLTGTIPDLSALTALQSLWLNNNELTGTIPDLSAATALNNLWLNDNQLSGPLTASHFPASLVHLVLNNNRLTGTIPDLSALTGLEFLGLSNNRLTGTIPDLSALTDLESLGLSNNRLTGPIPSTLNALTQLEQLYLQDNQLTGSIPSTLNALTLLEGLFLQGNRLSGSIPDLSALTALGNLWLHQNQLSGPLVASRFPTAITRLQLAGNPLTGGIPSGLDSLSALSEISLCGTDLNADATLPSGLETRRMGGELAVYSCLRIEDATAIEGSPLSFTVTHDAYPVRGSSGTPSPASLSLRYRTGADGDTAIAGDDYTGTDAGTLTIAANTDPSATSSSASITVDTFVDAVPRPETMTVTLRTSADEVSWDDQKVLPLRRAATGTIRIPLLAVSARALTVAEGGEASYTVRLGSQPPSGRGSAHVYISSDNPDVTTSPGSLDFTRGNWNTAQTVTVKAARDDDNLVDIATLSHLVNGGRQEGSGDGADVKVTVTGDANDPRPVDPPPANPPPAAPPSGGGGGGGSGGGRRPEVAEALEARSVPSGGALALDLSAAFRSPGGGALSFTASSSEPAVASVSVEGAALTVRGLLPGVAEIAVTATDGAGRSISQRFALTVTAPEAAWHLPPAADPFLQGFVRVVNHSAAAGEVAVTAVDDAGQEYAPLTLRLGPHAVAHFNSDDLEAGNAAKGLSGGAGPGAGGWRLAFGGGGLDAEAIGLLRTADGFVTAMAATAPRGADGALRLLTFNPAGNTNQASRLRLVNPTDAEARATVTGTDDSGASPGSPVALTLPAGSACEVGAAALESGRGLACGAPQAGLGDGAGKWRLSIASEAPLVAMGLLSSPGGHLTNLSAALPEGAGGVRRVPLFPSASDPYGRQGFVRVANRSGRAGTVAVRAFDDGGRVRERLSLRLGARQARQFNSDDLELGAPAKGLSGRTGSGTGAWRLELSSADIDFEAGAYARHADGFLTAMQAAAPSRDGAHRVATFNPGSNANQASRLRLVNWGSRAASATVTGADDRGARPGGAVEVSVPAGSAVELTAAQLESGEAAAIASGALGDGAGKWRLRVASDADLSVMSLVSSPMGRLANWSGADESRGAPPLPSLPAPPAWVRLEDAGGRRVRGEWDAVPGMRYGVELLLDGAPLEGRSLARTARTSFRWSGLAPGAYALRARSVDADGKAGPWSPPTDEVVID